MCICIYIYVRRSTRFRSTLSSANFNNNKNNNNNNSTSCSLGLGGCAGRFGGFKAFSFLAKSPALFPPMEGTPLASNLPSKSVTFTTFGQVDDGSL